MHTSDERRQGIRIFIVDRHPLAREGLAVLLTQKGFEICGEADNGDGALRGILQTRPDVVMLDVPLGDSHGVDLIADLKRIAPEIPVLVCALTTGSVFVERAMEAGAMGCITKQEVSKTAFAAVKEILAGRMFFGHGEHRG